MVDSYWNSLKTNAKNLFGYRSTRRIVVFSVDDYGNVRVDSKLAREKMDKAGLKVSSRFDAFDSLENREDLEILYETLTSVKDSQGRHAVFTPFALPCNLNFEGMAEDNYSNYYYESLPETYRKLESRDPRAYEGTWPLWQQGITSGIMIPQFHGREHLNLKVLEEKLAKRDPELIIALQNRSYSSISNSGYPTIRYTAAFDFWDFADNATFSVIIKEGLQAFERVFGYKAVHFNPPGGREHNIIHRALESGGIRYIDTALITKEHQGKGKYQFRTSYTGKRNNLGQSFLVRNVVFEPTYDRGFNWIAYTMKQIEIAFKWHRPANISSHRVNFCGHIDPENRKQGNIALKKLLKEIVERWPDVEFLAAHELGHLVSDS